jgi:hypothetical protein
MKAEKRFDIPMHLRMEVTVSDQSGKGEHRLGEAEWEDFYARMKNSLQRQYPELYGRLFPSQEMSAKRLAQARAAIRSIVGSKGVLLRIFFDRMQARGFHEDETRSALDSIAEERLVHIQSFKHRILKDHLHVRIGAPRQPGDVGPDGWGA